MLNVVCVQAGNYEGRGSEYVNVLFDSVRRNLPDGYEGKFVCFTDNPEGLDPRIEARPLPQENLAGWWNKLALFKKGVFEPEDRVVFLDLDTLVTGRLDDVLAYDGPFAILRDFYRPQGLQSAVMAWSGDQSDIWEGYLEAGCPDIHGGDQAWIEQCRPDATRLQDVFPDAFVSYKLIKGPPEAASVVCFHGRPRPHEVVDGWVPLVWKIDGLSRAELDAVCNTETEKLMANVRSACKRNLPWFDFKPVARDGSAVIVGGGPSLRDTLSEIVQRKRRGQQIWALNNSAKFLQENGVDPDVHVIVDARPENAEFVKKSKASTFYIASQCDPAVFEALKGRKVILWHVNSPGMDKELGDVKNKPVSLVGGGTTVGLLGTALAFLSGFRKVHLHGFDSSFRDVDHHAYSQVLNDQDKVVDVLYGDKHFKCAPWMSQQATEFIELAGHLRASGCLVTVHGDGLLPTMFHDDRMYGPMTAAEIRASEVLKKIEGIEKPIGAEIGVFTGAMSAALLFGNDLRLVMVDSWEPDGKAYADVHGDFHAALSKKAQEHCFQETLLRTSFAGDRAEIVRMRSVSAASRFPDGHFDFVFIDADHSYEGCARDIDAWLPKVKAGGWICGHDYQNPPFEGVDRAVNEFIGRSGLKLETGENFTWFAQLEHQLETA